MSDVPVQLIVAAFQDEGDSLVVDDTGVYESKFNRHRRCRGR